MQSQTHAYQKSRLFETQESFWVDDRKYTQFDFIWLAAKGLTSDASDFMRFRTQLQLSRVQPTHHHDASERGQHPIRRQTSINYTLICTDFHRISNAAMMAGNSRALQLYGNTHRECRERRKKEKKREIIFSNRVVLAHARGRCGKNCVCGVCI